MRRNQLLFVLGLMILPQLLAVPARADSLDQNTRTECRGNRCVGSYCSVDGDAYNCWQESVYRRKANEEVHWVCTKRGHHCSWLRGPLPDDDAWGVIHF